MSYARLDSYISKMINRNINNTHILFVMVDNLANPPKQNSFTQSNVMDLLAFLVKKKPTVKTDHQQHTVK